jgi:hypothetical protein
MRLLPSLVLPGLLFAWVAQSQSRGPVTVDPRHYKEQLTADGIRVVGAKFGPREKGRLQSEPKRLIVCVTSANLRTQREDGKYNEFMCKPGAVTLLPAGTHQLENIADHVTEFVTIEVTPATHSMPRRDP